MPKTSNPQHKIGPAPVPAKVAKTRLTKSARETPHRFMIDEFRKRLGNRCHEEDRSLAKKSAHLDVLRTQFQTHLIWENNTAGIVLPKQVRHPPAAAACSWGKGINFGETSVRVNGGSCNHSQICRKVQNAGTVRILLSTLRGCY